MKSATVSALRTNLDAYLNQAEPVVVTQKGHAKAVLMPVENPDDLERLMMANNTELMRILDEAERSIRDTGGVPHDELWAKVDRKYKNQPAGRRTKKVKK